MEDFLSFMKCIGRCNFRCKSKIILLSLFLINFSCANAQQDAKVDTLNVTLIDFGKFKPLSAEFYEETQLPKKSITSALYVRLEGNNSDILTIPINDDLFNYEYFNENIYPNITGRKVTLKVEKYIIDEKNVLIALHIQ